MEDKISEEEVRKLQRFSMLMIIERIQSIARTDAQMKKTTKLDASTRGNLGSAVRETRIKFKLYECF